MGAQMKPTAQRVACAYCGTLFHRQHDRSSCCSRRCRQRWVEVGFRSRADVEAVHPRNRRPQPKGCPDVASFLAAGGYVFRLPAVANAD